MLLELDVYFWPEDYDSESAENLGRKPNLKKDVLVIHSEHVCAFNPHDNGHTMIRLSNGEVFEVDIKFDAFRAIMEEAELQKDMFVSGEN